ncbi:HAMP domain-containing histidine kinase [Lichenihabitans sp. PAMC28606]|uniref:sensor histidine kinase n=1 Tax=Lichenihabitans sp. PAMC28606 TaxID=2880932 RepID=UPI001D0B7AFF|nr:HAMP domain-containing sensor histidine kinase [Lichenihabitans sp. PAMC28606]UDL94281.1 HAMP domain-containing histidine kinase [Lichenihabitans sp. PAMC28606]
MMPTSLAGRLVGGAAIFIMLALLIAGGVIGAVLEHFVRGQIDQRLDGQLHAVADALVAPGGRLDLTRNVDAPPFDLPGSGWAWQVGHDGIPVLRSRSLGPASLGQPAGPVPALGLPPPFAPLDPQGREPARDRPKPAPPLSQEMAAPDWGRAMPDGGGPWTDTLLTRSVQTTIDAVPVVITATAPQRALRGPLRGALLTVGASLLVLAAAFLAAVLLQVRVGLRPLTALRSRLAEVRHGRTDRIVGSYPQELQPLVDELNALLEQNAESLVRARRHVSNLAHGLKTPLASLAVALDGPGHDPQGRYHALLDLMDRQIRHHLRRARAAALGSPARSQVALAPRVADLATALVKIYADKALRFDNHVPPGIAVACDQQDVDEMLGNLLDNACKWARGVVIITAVEAGRLVALSIADDGPGLAPDRLPDVLRPGRRLDESTPGYGFGLPITRELAELYGGALSLGSSSSGGLSAVLTLPAAAAL